MATSFPNVSFDWLGQLPQLGRAAQIERESRAALADLNPSSIEDLEKAGARLFKVGNMEMGLRLLNAANQRRVTEINASRLKEFDPSYWKPLMDFVTQPRGGAQQGGTPLPSIEEGPIDYGAPAAPPALPSWMGTVGPGAALPSPSEELLDRAQAQTVPQAPTRVAQAGPPIGLGGGLQPQAPIPFLPGAQPPPPAAPSRALPPAPLAPNEAEREQLDRMRAVAPFVGRAPAPVQAIIGAEYRNALSQSNPDAKQRQYEFTQRQRASQGLSQQSYSDWQADPEVRKADYTEMQKVYAKYQDDARSNREIGNIVTQMRSLMTDPAFMSGPGTQTWGKVLGGLNTLAQIGKQFGIDVPDVSSLTRPAAVIDAFNALNGRLTIASLGGLGRQISDGDRRMMSETFPSLLMTPEGIRILTPFIEKLSDRAQTAEKIAAAYRRARGGRANAFDMEESIRRYSERNPLFVGVNGKLTEDGEKLMNVVNRLGGQVPVPGAAAAPQTGPSNRLDDPRNQGRSVIGPDGKRWKVFNGQLIPEGAQGL